MTNIIRLSIVVLLMGVLTWMGGTLFALHNVHFKDKQTSCMFRYWAATWPLWKITPKSTEQEFVNWTADKCGSEL